MALRTDISWTDATWPIVEGCDYVSPGCSNCYAVNSVYRFSHHPNPKISLPLAGLTDNRDRVRWTGKVALRRDKMGDPLRWKKPQKVFVTSLGDLFHDDVPDDFLLEVFAVMHRARHHTYQVLTKRPERMLEFSRRLCLDERNDRLYLATVGGRPYLPLAPHIWCGTSVENQEWADKRIPVLLQVDCRVRFLSVEPLIGPINLRSGIYAMPPDDKYQGTSLEGISWTIIGGESGPRARLCDMDWMRSIRNQCKAAGVALWVKQAGTRPCNGSILLPYTGRPRATLDELPIDLRTRQFPEVKK